MRWILNFFFVPKGGQGLSVWGPPGCWGEGFGIVSAVDGKPFQSANSRLVTVICDRMHIGSCQLHRLVFDLKRGAHRCTGILASEYANKISDLDVLAVRNVADSKSICYPPKNV